MRLSSKRWCTLKIMFHIMCKDSINIGLRGIGSYLKLGGQAVMCGGAQSASPLVEIGLTDLPEWAIAHPSPSSVLELYRPWPALMMLFYFISIHAQNTEVK